MKKFLRFFYGTGIMVVTWLAGFLIWYFYMDTVSMTRPAKDDVSRVIGLSVLPALVVYLFWYMKRRKDLRHPASRSSGKLLYIIIGVLLTLAVLFFAMIFDLQKAFSYIALSVGLNCVGSSLAYFIGEPKF